MDYCELSDNDDESDVVVADVDESDTMDEGNEDNVNRDNMINVVMRTMVVKMDLNMDMLISMSIRMIGRGCLISEVIGANLIMILI